MRNYETNLQSVLGRLRQSEINISSLQELQKSFQLIHQENDDLKKDQTHLKTVLERVQLSDVKISSKLQKLKYNIKQLNEEKDKIKLNISKTIGELNCLQSKFGSYINNGVMNSSLPSAGDKSQMKSLEEDIKASKNVQFRPLDSFEAQLTTGEEKEHIFSENDYCFTTQ